MNAIPNSKFYLQSTVILKALLQVQATHNLHDIIENTKTVKWIAQFRTQFKYLVLQTSTTKLQGIAHYH